jgi:hypothetical protein
MTKLKRYGERIATTMHSNMAESKHGNYVRVADIRRLIDEYDKAMEDDCDYHEHTDALISVLLKTVELP